MLTYLLSWRCAIAGMQSMDTNVEQKTILKGLSVCPPFCQNVRLSVCCSVLYCFWGTKNLEKTMRPKTLTPAHSVSSVLNWEVK